MPRKFFTVEHANRALPLVRRIVDDLVASYREWQALQQEGDPPREVQERLFDLQGRVEHCAQELQAVGCELKDPERGLLDFYAHRGKEVIFLCWMRGEEEVAWWHPLHTGFPGRRPVSDLPEETLRG